jgi:signal transduction histidine kinase
MVGIVAEIAVQIPFAVLGQGPFVGSLGALPVGIACLIGFLAGPAAGATVAVAGWTFFFPLVVHWSPFGILALALWVGPAVLFGLVARRLRAREQQLIVFEAERRYEELRSELANQAHHEVRTPAAVIYGMADVLLRDEIELTPEQKRKFLGLIAESAQQLTDVSERLETIEPMANVKALPLLKVHEAP